jgi:hypothetical protein
MWGDPHISVGRRVERPIQCRKVAEASQADDGRASRRARTFVGQLIRSSWPIHRCGNDRDLPSLITCPVREEPIVVALRARRADADPLDPCLGRVLRNQGPEVDVTWSRRELPRQLLSNLGGHFVASTADSRPKVDRELVGWESVTCESRDGLSGDPGRSPPPSRMKKCDDARRMRDENRHAVRNSHREGNPPFGRDMSVGLVTAEPTLPTSSVYKDPGAVDLPDGHKTPSDVDDVALHCRPATHHLVHRIVAGEAEGAGITGCGKRANSPALEVGDYFLRNLTHAYCRRSSTRVIAAPSLLRRSSIRS